MITAPYNFVPLNEKVFYPPWAEDISHDIPFSDGESGEIEITIEAKSPIFIRNHSNDKDNPSTEFCNYNGTYFIPGSSFKGMVRNVLEIISFSKMSFIDDRTYAVRDLSSAQNFYMKQMNLIDEPFTQCGWLKKTDNGYVIEDCGEPGRISHKEIDKAFDIKFAKYFEAPLFNEQDKTQKTAEYKYEKLKLLKPKIKVGDAYISTTNPKYDKRKFHKYNENGKEGILVLTGQPTPRKNTGKMGDGKGFEFIFFESKKELQVDKKVFEDFKFAYFDSRDTEPKESEDWKFWKEKLYKGEKVPVFFQKNASGKILHFGLSYLYKLPYKHSTKDGLYQSHNEKTLDLAEVIFGYVKDKDALKGRVQFSHFKALANSVKVLEERTEVLGTPRASYYPNYIMQTKKVNPYITYMDNGFKISGWKRYPIQKEIQHYSLPKSKDGKVNTKVGTIFKPLDKGVKFTGKMRYHNLKKAELGAIFSALTFHNTKECHHSIGMAKPLGYGKIEIKIDGIEIKEYLKEFETEITASLGSWAESEQIIELLTMASIQNNNRDSELRYMELKEFAKNKASKNYLQNYSHLSDIVIVKPKSLIDENDILEKKKYYDEFKKKRDDAKKEQEEQKRRIKEQQEMEDSYQEAIESEDLSKLQSFLDRYPTYGKIKDIEEKLKEIKNKQKKDKHKEINDKAKKAYEVLLSKKSNQKQYKKEKEKFIKKWSASKNNKNSEYILQLIDKLNKEK